ncbi:phosphoglycerate mutase-like protein [Xylariaceae sp. FL0804]|nr:phosphoglycerate mutase-like protein [Xylariaceae sp. FL0804]
MSRSIMSRHLKRVVDVVAVLGLLARTGTAAAITASPDVGSPVSDVYPPTGTSVDTAQFPPASVVGFGLTTATGAEPAAAQTAPVAPDNSGPAGQFPLVYPAPLGSDADADTGTAADITRLWGNLSPWYSLSSADYGLPAGNASAAAPDGCALTQVHLLYRHGARYPTSGSGGPPAFAEKLANASTGAGGPGFAVDGGLSFLADWTYKLGAELLTPFGRGQNFLLGLEARQLYGSLLSNFTRAGALPVFRTESQDRMVKTATNFVAGFFGVPEYLDQVSLEILVESPGVNNSGAPYEVCDNANVDSRGSIGTAASEVFLNTAFNATLDRLNSQITGLQFDTTDVYNMLQLCSYETIALGYSEFCALFTLEDFINYEYMFDIAFYYNNGPGSPVSAAQGKGYLQEFVARFTGEYPAPASSLNETYDNSTTYFPLNQSIYADATHEVVIMDTLMAFNLTALFDGPPLSLTGNEHRNTFKSSHVVPFATHFTVQVLECQAYQPTKQMRFLLNDAVIPVSKSHPGCPDDPHGLCSFDQVVSVLQQRMDEIDYDYACFANYTASAGNDYNGLPPRSSATTVLM